jgi:2-keto-4-pentenoate hydratase/2-oxohepta-3-ene-1,7-dioic acid hydratase in catechol pathway
MNPPQWLREGDVVELDIDGLGAQRQRVGRATAAPR